MAERPILFSAPMVRAILAGRKTATRRGVKPEPPSTPGSRPEPACDAENCGTSWHWRRADGGCEWHIDCRYGVPGDRLWVRETFATIAHGPGLGVRIRYDATPEREDHRVIDPAPDREDRWRPLDWKRRPGIHMPRWASRITLEVTGVRVERLHEITEADARAEGVEREEYDWGHGWAGALTGDGVSRVPMDCARSAFMDLWGEINGRASWDANPFVWVVSFKRVQP